MESIFFPEAQEAIRLLNSPAVQEAMKLANSPAAREAMRIMNSPEFQAAQRALEYINSPAVKQALLQHSNMQRLLDDSPGQGLSDSLIDTLIRVEPYLPPAEKEQCEAIVKPKLKEKSSTQLTLSDALSLLSLLVAIFFGIVSSMPNEQAERIIAQNEIIIEQRNEIVQLKKEDEALLDALDSLSNSINLLTDEVKLLREELERSGDFPDSSGQSDTENTQQQDCDTQD